MREICSTIRLPVFIAAVVVWAYIAEAATPHRSTPRVWQPQQNLPSVVRDRIEMMRVPVASGRRVFPTKVWPRGDAPKKPLDEVLGGIPGTHPFLRNRARREELG